MTDTAVSGTELHDDRCLCIEHCMTTLGWPGLRTCGRRLLRRQVVVVSSAALAVGAFLSLSEEQRAPSAVWELALKTLLLLVIVAKLG